MTDEKFNAKLSEIVAKVDHLPAEQRARMAGIVAETEQRHRELSRDFSRIREAVDDWRLTMKYLVYDLEMTRAELRQLRRDENES